MKFYMPDGRKELARSEFIRLYAANYYLESAKQVPKISQSSRFIENEMERLLKNGIRTQQDVAHILAWKIGKIVHKKSVSKFVYASDWQDAEHLNVTRYGRPFELAKLANYIVENIERLELDAVSNPQGVLNEFRTENIVGIGTVYLITLLYFLSKGKYPIYDQFAKKALDAITRDRRPGESIKYKGLPEKIQKVLRL